MNRETGGASGSWVGQVLMWVTGQLAVRAKLDSYRFAPRGHVWWCQDGRPSTSAYYPGNEYRFAVTCLGLSMAVFPVKRDLWLLSGKTVLGEGPPAFTCSAFIPKSSLKYDSCPSFSLWIWLGLLSRLGQSGYSHLLCCRDSWVTQISSIGLNTRTFFFKILCI